MKLLFTWLGRTDIAASKNDPNVGMGPIGQAVSNLEFDEIIILSDLDRSDAEKYCKWLGKHTNGAITLEKVKLTDPTDFGEIYEGARRIIDNRLAKKSGSAQYSVSFHLSPGTPSMAAVWILLAKTRYPAELIQSSKESGVRVVSLPFDISAEYIPTLLRKADNRLASMAEGTASDVTGFGDVLFRSKSMAAVVDLAKRFALHGVPVLIEGESGTGKEVFARAIHASGPRRDGRLITVNCGAIPESLVESELFGHRRGAFSGADRDRLGHFVEADGGTIFLDEIGELPLAAQVKLLRVLQENEVTPVGASQPRKINVRVISATNRNLLEEVAKGAFREDLFYRLAVFMLQLPPLRNREGDLNLFIDEKLRKINESNQREIWPENKKLSPAARNILLRHGWPGNIRELEHTLLRAAVMSNGTTITEQDIEQALFSPASGIAGVLDRPLGNGLDLRKLLAEVSRHYLSRALIQANGNKTLAASLVGLPNYQTFTNWLQKYDVEDHH